MKKTIIKRTVSIILLISIFGGYSLQTAPERFRVYGVTQTDIDDAKKDKESIEKQLDKTKNEIANLKKSASDLLDYIKNLDEKVDELNYQIYTTQAKITELNKKIDNTQEKLDEAQIKADQQYEAMKKRIKFMYERNNQNYIDVILKSQDMADMLNKIEYIVKMSDYDRNMLNEYNDNIQFIASAKEELVADKSEVENELADLKDSQAAASYAQKEKNEQLEVYNNQIAQTMTKQELLEKQEDEQQKMIDNLIAQAEREQAASNGNASVGITESTGVLMWPTKSRRITSYYGETEGRNHVHAGIDIGAVVPRVDGDPIYAADGGKVITALTGWNGGAGNYIILQHSDGMYTVYMHCSKLLVSKGDVVSKGETIALMGNTGNSTGTHLHFEVRVNGVKVNPLKYVS